MFAWISAVVFVLGLISAGDSALAATLEEPRPAQVIAAPQTVNAPFVQAAFTVVLSRPASPSDVSYWMQQHLTRVSLVQDLIDSQEFRVAAVTVLSQHFLARPPAPSYLQMGTTPAQAEIQFASSQEYYVKAGGKNPSFLAQLYTDALGRTITSNETAYWMTQLAQGQSISHVATAVLQSAEGTSHLTLLLFQGAMHRSGTPNGPTLASAALAAAQQITQ